MPCIPKFAKIMATTSFSSMLVHAIKLNASSSNTINTYDNHPSHLVCPITHDLFVDPILFPDGHIYERSAINKYITEVTDTDRSILRRRLNEVTSPLTREIARLDIFYITTLPTVLEIKEQIEKYKQNPTDFKIYIQNLNPNQVNKATFHEWLRSNFNKSSSSSIDENFLRVIYKYIRSRLSAARSDLGQWQTISVKRKSDNMTGKIADISECGSMLVLWDCNSESGNVNFSSGEIKFSDAEVAKCLFNDFVDNISQTYNYPPSGNENYTTEVIPNTNSSNCTTTGPLCDISFGLRVLKKYMERAARAFASEQISEQINVIRVKRNSDGIEGEVASFGLADNGSDLSIFILWEDGSESKDAKFLSDGIMFTDEQINRFPMKESDFN